MNLVAIVITACMPCSACALERMEPQHFKQAYSEVGSVGVQSTRGVPSGDGAAHTALQAGGPQAAALCKRGV